MEQEMVEHVSQHSSEAIRSKIMRSNRATGSRPELAFRQILHARGFRYRVNARPVEDVRRTADILFRKQKLAVFIDGCFWHRCPEHGSQPKSNSHYWTPKLEKNVQRDEDTNNRLMQAGWSVLRFWEHEDPEFVSEQIASTWLDLHAQLDVKRYEC